MAGSFIICEQNYQAVRQSRGNCSPLPQWNLCVDGYSPFFFALGGSSPFKRRYIAACE
jgi:hypothetical protein